METDAHVQPDFRGRIPYSTFATFVVDTAASSCQQGDKGFFRNQAQTHIAHALEALYEIQADVTLENAHELLLNQEDLDNAIGELQDGYPTERRPGARGASRFGT